MIKESLGNSKLVKPWEDGRILINTPFDRSVKRISSDLAEIRNRLMIDFSDSLVVDFAYSSRNLEKLIMETEGNKVEFLKEL